MEKEREQKLNKNYQGNTLIFSSGKLISVFQSCKHTINRCYLKQPTLWQFVTAAIKKNKIKQDMQIKKVIMWQSLGEGKWNRPRVFRLNKIRHQNLFPGHFWIEYNSKVNKSTSSWFVWTKKLTEKQWSMPQRYRQLDFIWKYLKCLDHQNKWSTVIHDTENIYHNCNEWFCIRSLTTRKNHLFHRFWADTL